VFYRKNSAVNLRVGLYRVAAVNKERRTIVEDDGSTCRASKTGKPSQTFFTLRQIFVLLAICARHDEAIESAALEFAAQFSDPRCALRSLARNVEGLKAGFKHRRTLMPRTVVAMQACASATSCSGLTVPDLCEEI
jgi:hypothetical protein